MSSNHNQQQPHYFHQHTPGPAQPPWQAPQRGWGDPRPSHLAQSPIGGTPASPFGNGPGQQQFPPPPPPPAGGFPQQFDTSGWGVKHNQGQPFSQSPNTTLRPPLPPRPPSALSDQQPGWAGQSINQGPPVPPPRPVEYASIQQPSQSQYFPHEQFSYRPPSHHYEPQPTQWPQQPPASQQQSQYPTPQPTWQPPQNFQDVPVSPLDHQRPGWHVAQLSSSSNGLPYNPQAQASTLPQASTRPQVPPIPAPSASALGSGGPSEWEHYPDEGQDYQHQVDYAAQNQLNPHSRHGSLAYSVTPEQMHATPANPNPGATQQSGVPTSVTTGSVGQTQNQFSPRFASLPQSQDVTATYNQSFQHVDPNFSNASSKAGTIDSVMNAWNASAAQNPTIAPLNSASKPSSTFHDHPPLPREVANVETQTDFPPITKIETQIQTKIETREVDPYEDLRNEYRTSLNRYATMLREEMSTHSEQEKMKVVFDFVNKEVKLRAVLFNAQPAELVRSVELKDNRDAIERMKTEINALSVQFQQEGQLRKAAEEELKKSTEQLQHSEELRRAAEKQVEEFKQSLEEVRASEAAHMASVKGINVPAGRESSPNPRSAGQRPPPINTHSSPSQSGRDDGFVVVNKDSDEAEYSPGGRPKVVQPLRLTNQQRSGASTFAATTINQAPSQAYRQPTSPASNAPMTLDDYVMPENIVVSQPNRSVNAALGQTVKPDNTAPFEPPKIGSNTAPITFHPIRPAYTPFKYNQNEAPTVPMVTSHHTADQAYSKLRYEQAAESGRLLTQDVPFVSVTAPERSSSAVPSRARQQHEEAFIGLLRSQSKAVRRPQTAPPIDPSLRAGTPVWKKQSLPPLTKSTDTLRQYLPSTLPQMRLEEQSHPLVAPLAVAMSNFVDDFSYIKATVVAWDRDNRLVRQRLEAERNHRESESQSRIDELFNANEIGYADIAGLEEDFKVEEAGRKYREEQDELESFTTGVFKSVSEKLQLEISELENIHSRATDILDHASQSASSCIRVAVSDSSNAMGKVSLTEAMDLLLQLYSKIEVRQTKLAEAHFERERRRKRLELSVLYTNGDMIGVKQLEKDFDQAQALQVRAEAQKRDKRANKLMDGFDRAVVRGLAENQEWVDEMSNRASLLRDLVLGSESNGPQGRDREELLYGSNGVKEVFDTLHDAVSMISQDSKDLVSMSTQADKVLNEADFAMFIAEAKITNADEKEYEKLRTEKVKEDLKLKEEAEGRLNGTQRGPDEIFGVVKDVRDFIGNDKDHQSRISSALERARERTQLTV